MEKGSTGGGHGRNARLKKTKTLLTRTPKTQQAQTLEQRRRNAKFTKEQDARRGKSENEIKKRGKDAPKSPISPFWLGKSSSVHKQKQCNTIQWSGGRGRSRKNGKRTGLDWIGLDRTVRLTDTRRLRIHRYLRLHRLRRPRVRDHRARLLPIDGTRLCP